jgi:hypothetical protein
MPQGRRRLAEGVSLFDDRFDGPVEDQRQDLPPCRGYRVGGLGEERKSLYPSALPDQVGHINRRLASGRVAQGDQGSAKAQGAQRLAGDGPTDTVDDNVDPLAPSEPVRALAQTFGGEVYDVFEPEVACLGGFRCATRRRDYLVGALRPRELIDGVADRAADS